MRLNAGTATAPSAPTAPRASYLQSRRGRVQLLTIRGLASEQIAALAGVDEATVRYDQQANAQEALAREPLVEERARLLAAAKQVEQAAWQIFRDLPSHVVE